ncbi:MAG: hypothetical protein LBR37_01105 [Erysipelotrichaceae bacterium]|nr:hypothetical protein [Erysipelotrichaceae bacterium]
MFNHLRRRIILTISLLSSVFILIISIPFIILYQNLYAERYYETIQSALNLEKEYTSYQVTAFGNKTRVLSQDPELSSETPRLEIVRRQLDIFATSDRLILGVSYYLASSAIANSTTSGIPTLTELSQVAVIEEYLSSSSSEPLFFTRDTAIANAFYNTAYDESNGIISLIKKIPHNNAVILVDFSTTNLREAFFSLEPNIFSNYLIEVTSYSGISEIDTSAGFLMHDDNESIYTLTIDRLKITINFEHSYLLRQNGILLVILISSDIVLIVLSLFISFVAAKYITEPLKRINKRIDEETI